MLVRILPHVCLYRHSAKVGITPNWGIFLMDWTNVSMRLQPPQEKKKNYMVFRFHSMTFPCKFGGEMGAGGISSW